MTTPTNTVTQLAQKLTQKYDPELFLGHLCWYSIPDTVTITRNAFVQTLSDHGVPFGGSIPEIRAVDVFKRGCKDAQRNKYIPTPNEKVLLALPDDCHINYMLRNSGQDVDKVWRSLVREVVDSSGHKIAYEEIASLIYNRSTKSISHVNSSVISLPVESDIIKGIYAYFNEEATRITPYSIREFVRKGLEWHLLAIKVRPSGGIYFTQNQFAETVAALEAAINSIGGSFHTLPLLDDSKQREMLKKAFEDESLDEVSELMAEMTDIMQNNKTITSDRYSDLKVRYNKLMKKVLDYSDVLDEAMETTASYLEVANNQIVKLLSNVKQDEA